MSEQLKYFITSFTRTTSAGELPMFVCRVVNEKYKEFFTFTLEEEDKDIFKLICSDNKYALLYKNHPKLYDLALFKIEQYSNCEIFNGNIYP